MRPLAKRAGDYGERFVGVAAFAQQQANLLTQAGAV